MSEWQPIETAPRDGTMMLVWAKEWSCPVLMTREGRDGIEYWLIGDTDGDGFPTHWMPLPELPR